MLEKHAEVVRALKDRLEEHAASKKAARAEVEAAIASIRKQIDDFEKRVDADLQEKFAAEDSRLQRALDDLQALAPENNSNGNETNASDSDSVILLEEAIQKASAELAVRQKYSVEKVERVVSYIEGCLEVEATKELVKDWLVVDTVRNLRATVISAGRVFIDFETVPNKILAANGIEDTTVYQAVVHKESGNGNDSEREGEASTQSYFIKAVDVDGKRYYSFLPDSMEPETTYSVRVKGSLAGRESALSEATAFTTLDFARYCEWKECPEYVPDRNVYAVQRRNRRLVSKVNASDFCTVTGTTSLPAGRTSAWGVRMAKLRDRQRANVNVGVAPYDINQGRREVYSKCGWYLCCYYSTLTSGPPHNYDFRSKEYGPRKKSEQYVHIGDTVGVTVDTARGTISFALNGVDLGVAYEGVPLDKPLVPCVHLRNEFDAVELIIQQPTVPAQADQPKEGDQGDNQVQQETKKDV